LFADFTASESITSAPLFIFGFIVLLRFAASVQSLLPQLLGIWQTLSLIARQGLVVTLFMVGNGLTASYCNGRESLAQGK